MGPNDAPRESEDGSVSEVRRNEGGAMEEMGPIGKLAEAVLASFEQMEKPEDLKDARLVVFIDTDREGIMSTFGYEDDASILAAVLSHVKAVLIANGSDLDVIGVDELRQMMVGGRN